MDLSTGYPYWLINDGLPKNYPKLEQSLRTDVAIIGGGISGALTAYFLTKAGIECTVVDGRTIGLGSTCASTSLLQYELDKPLSELSEQIGFKSAARAYTLCSEAIDTIQKISKDLNFKLFEKQKSLYFAAHKQDKQFLEKEFKFRKEAGMKVRLMDEKEIQNHFGFTASSAILSSQGASTDAYSFTHKLLQASIKEGLAVYDRTSIVKINYQKKGVRLTTEEGFVIHAAKVVNASGYEISDFINKKIVTLHSTYAIVSEHVQSPVPAWKDKTLLWNTANPYLYMRLTKDNRIIVGGRDEDFYNVAKRDELIKSKTNLLQKDFSKLFPSINFTTEFSWAGTFGSTADSLPYIGTYRKTPHTFYALGFGGNGITFSVIAAKIIRDLLLGKKKKDAELFSFNRQK